MRRKEKQLAAANVKFTTKAVACNLSSVLAYLANISLQRLDGLWFALSEKLDKLGCGHARGAHQSCDYDSSISPTANLGDIIAFVEKSTDQNAADLQAMHSLIASRFELTGSCSRNASQ